MNILLNSFIAVFFFFSLGCSDKKKDINLEQVNSKKSDHTIEVYAKELEVPWSIVFTSENRVLVNERPGRLRIIENGKLLPESLKKFDEVSNNSEEGLMGLVMDPDYKANKLIYLSYAYKKGDALQVKVIRFKDNGNSLSDEMLIIDNLPAAQYHAGCRLKFGPDKKLYITTGDAGDRKFAQDLNKMNGKILRVNNDGTIPEDNPFSKSPVWSYGHRNPQGIDWVPGSGTDIMWETEHGPSGFDGPGGGDEVNVIVKGLNYGWPEVSHTDSKEGMVSPILVFTPAEAPASGMFYRSGKIAEFKDCFLFGCLKGEGIMVVKTNPNDKTKALSFTKIATDFGRIRDITEGPDGNIYFSSSNRDGRGKVHEGDDKIYRITSK
jgi:glucose/arabinose dehydrogenase